MTSDDGVRAASDILGERTNDEVRTLRNRKAQADVPYCSEGCRRLATHVRVRPSDPGLVPMEELVCARHQTSGSLI